LHYISQFVKDKSSRKPNWVLSETNEFKITQIVDNAQMVQLTLVENVTTEPVSQKQLIIENVSKKLDSETKEQVMPLLEAILQAQPTINIKTYQQTQITITMPKSRYNNMGRPQVGNIIEVDLKKI
jgi:phage-related protein